MNGPPPPGEGLSALLRHARALVGTTLAEIADGLGLPVPAGHVRSKGWPGQVIERELGAGAGGVRGPDFVELGVELKTVPLDPRGVPLESTCVCHIDPVGIAEERWEESYLRRKLARVLFVALTVPASQGGVKAPVGDRRVRTVTLWTPSAEEERLLRADFELFVSGFFRPGRAAEITGHAGRVLQVRPKGRNAADLTSARGPDGSPQRIGRCGFYLRPAFVGRIVSILDSPSE